MITLNDIRKPLRKEIQRNIYNGQLKDYKNIDEVYYGMFSDSRLDFDVYLESKGINLQRPFVWTLKQKQELILSMLKGVDIPAITVIISRAQDDTNTIKVIDGKQRLSTMIDFRYNKFPLSFNGEDYFYRDFKSAKESGQTYRENIKHAIDSYSIQFNQVHEYWDDKLSDDELIEWFEQINFMGTPQDEEHLKTLKSSTLN